jgi:hypothetical protein
VNLSALVADIDGHQRKIVMSDVRPARAAHGDSGIALRDGVTLPFVVTRAWNAPAGHYSERWYLVDPNTREVLFEGPEHFALIWGLLSWTELTDDVAEAIPLTPGSYLIVFALGGVQGGQMDVEAVESPGAEAPQPG